jgi:hypothetical protein
MKGGGYLLGHNRDEKLGRGTAVAPSGSVEWGGRICIAPVDPDGGGSWILVNDTSLAICLLNAGEREPDRLPASPRSRGLVVVALAGSSSVREVESTLDRMKIALHTTRAFHLVAVEPRPGSGSPRILRIAWDGDSLEKAWFDSPCLFVSNPLLQAAAEEARGVSWSRFLERTGEPDIGALRRWLANHEPERGPLSTCMHRDGARTVSRTILSVTGEGIDLFYTDGSPCDPEAPETHLRLGVKS